MENVHTSFPSLWSVSQHEATELSNQTAACDTDTVSKSEQAVDKSCMMGKRMWFTNKICILPDSSATQNKNMSTHRQMT